MPKFLERRLKRQYGAKSDIPYRVMNAIGAMRGSKTTAKGVAMERKHNASIRNAKTHTGKMKNG